ncbi:alpha/beta hydrolase [Nonomuraea sp. CA-143628]|uniref:alpha/beta hydrolase n=1 Tax=Nonomuraea sp. CA-143628 TaxID=3239997 RepID=UPI003D928E24
MPLGQRVSGNVGFVGERDDGESAVGVLWGAGQDAVHGGADAFAFVGGGARAEARVLTYEGSGQSVYGRSECTIGAIDRYLISQSVPANGVRCPEVRPSITPRRAGAN